MEQKFVVSGRLFRISIILSRFSKKKTFKYPASLLSVYCCINTPPQKKEITSYYQCRSLRRVFQATVVGYFFPNFSEHFSLKFL